MKLLHIVSNKVILYMVSRYLTYGLQFATTLIIASSLGPHDYGLWSFLLLIISFFNIIDFGISNSLSVLLVQNKTDKHMCQEYIDASIFINVIISIIVVLTFLTLHLYKVSLFEKYQSWEYFPFITIIVILAYFNKLFATIFRVNNKFMEVSVYQSLIPILIFAAILFCKSNALPYLVYSYVIGNILIFLYFLKSRIVRILALPKLISTKIVCFKGFWLFLYNSTFYLIMYFVLLSVSKIYPVEKYGKFSFSYTLANSIFLLIDAFGYIVFPKMIDKLKSDDYHVCTTAIDTIRTNYTTLVYLLVFLALPFFEIFASLINKYNDTGRALCLSAVALLPYASAFGINTYLIAQNKEKSLSLVSISCLVLTFVLLLIFGLSTNMPFDFYYLIPFIIYVTYTLLCSYISYKRLFNSSNLFKVTKYAFPRKKFIPIITAILSIYVSYELHIVFILVVPIVIYLLLNIKDIFTIYETFILIIKKPEIVDIEK